ncbi:PulJ/GspJ family protein [Paenibacillus wynnii]|uniref:PulJ/GspJ family protein n=1 Tax=Paenibacillus wynnii TaxID=268407 RepID=UPI00068993A0|nr:prepilin-type N-terminal cleavage/methylation domain-containing protein [Paenibacillus wynnii]
MMRKFVERGKSEQGFTLIELIAALTLFTMVAGLISGVTMFGFRSYHKITVENALRDEADIIMSSIITELYTYGPEQVRITSGGIELLKTGSPSHSIEVLGEDIIVNGKSTGAAAGSALALRSTMTGSRISATRSDGRASSVNAVFDSGLIQIELVLAYDGNNEDKMELESQFGF